MSVKKKTVSFDPQVYKSVCDHQADLIRMLGRPVSFSEAVDDLLKEALTHLSVAKEAEGAEG